MRVLDCFKREVKVGDFVAKASLSWKIAHLRVGKVVRISSKGNITIDQGKTDKGYQKKNISVAGYNFIILDPSSLPESFTSWFV